MKLLGYGETCAGYELIETKSVISEDTQRGNPCNQNFALSYGQHSIGIIVKSKIHTTLCVLRLLAVLTSAKTYCVMIFMRYLRRHNRLDSRTVIRGSKIPSAIGSLGVTP